MNILTSIKKTFEVSKISRMLAKPITYNDLMNNDKEEAYEKLFVLIEKYDNLQPVLKKHKANRFMLEEVYRHLLVAGAGQWVKGDFVAVSALAFPHTLDYALQMYNQVDPDWNEVSYQLIVYFQKGRTGIISNTTL